jgi:DNA primase small subunit
MLSAWYQMASCAVFREHMLRKVPHAVHMGAATIDGVVVNKTGTKPGKERFFKEVVFDLDAVDCHRFCDCGDAKRLCHVCWSQMQGAYLLLQHYLTRMQAYKPESILWVFSGKKGLHCLVNDSRALRLSADERNTLYHYLDDCTKSETALWEYIKTVQRHDQPFLQRLDKFFAEQVLIKHDLLGREDFRQFCFDLLAQHFKPMLPRLRLEWENDERSSAEKWQTLLELQQNFHKGVSASRLIVFKHFFPVIDSAPFVTTVHMIKLPFSAHSETGQLALPLDHNTVLGEQAPTVQQIGFVSLSDLPHDAQLAWDDTEKERLFKEGRRLLGEWVKNYCKL